MPPTPLVWLSEVTMANNLLSPHFWDLTYSWRKRTKRMNLPGYLLLQASNGRYVCRFPFPGHDQLIGEMGTYRDNPDENCQFTIIPLGDGFVALKADNGKHVARHPTLHFYAATKSKLEKSCKLKLSMQVVRG